MNIRFNVNSAGRRAFVLAVSEILGREAVYNRVPSFSYTIGGYTVDRDGALICPDDANRSETEQLISALWECGYTPETNNAPGDDLEPDDSGRLVIEIPRAGFSDEAVANLKKIIASKETLIKKALAADELPVEITGDKLCFPWFTLTEADGEADAYSRFIHVLCEMAKTQKRVTATERQITNDKFTMRVFLIRLGFIGDEYKTARKILLRNLNLTGNSSWRDGPPTASAGTDAAVTTAVDTVRRESGCADSADWVRK